MDVQDVYGYDLKHRSIDLRAIYNFQDDQRLSDHFGVVTGITVA